MENTESPSLISIYWTFFKVGLMTFGGGYAMLPILEREVVEKKGWITREEMLDYYATGQSLPGIIAVNVSTITATTKRGTPGGIVAALGVISPCIVIITIIAALLNGFRENEYVSHALGGITVCVSALILNTVIKLWKNGVKDAVQFVLFIVALVLSLLFDFSKIFYIIGAILIGLAVNYIMRRKAS